MIRGANIIFFILFLLITSCAVFKKKSTNPDSNPNTVNVKTEPSPILEKYSEKIGIPVSDEKLYSFIDEWYGVKYKYGGKSKSGIDCSNFSCQLLKEVYSFPSDFYAPSYKLAQKGSKVSQSEAMEGDLVFFSINRNSKISHVGVYLQNGKFVHASSSKGVVISSLNSSYYKSRLAYIKRMN